MADILTEYAEWWHKIMLNVGRKQTAIFEKDPDVYVDLLMATNCTRHLMKWVYGHLTCKKVIKRLEDYSTEEKQEIWDLVLDKCKAKCQDKTKLIEIAKVFCAIDYFLKENNGTLNRKV